MVVVYEALIDRVVLMFGTKIGRVIALLVLVLFPTPILPAIFFRNKMVGRSGAGYKLYLS